MMKLLSLFMATASAEALEATTGSMSDLTSMSLLSKGLLVTVAGLAGVFLVLFLFFITIKVMQKIK